MIGKNKVKCDTDISGVAKDLIIYDHLLPTQILRMLPRHSLACAARTCSRLRNLAADESLWRGVDLRGSSHVRPGTLGQLLLRCGTQALGAARANLVAPVMRWPDRLDEPLNPESCKLTALDLSAASVAPEELEQVKWEQHTGLGSLLLDLETSIT